MSHRPPGSPNRLADQSSPYLLLHRDNPVDWYPWGAEALARARAEDLPIFLSVGYSTCYWCHVMERESFSDPRVAALMNRFFVNIKVDREERPDLDEIYMAATQILTGQGGWPNSLFLTPDLKPFYAGTYFPPIETHGRPSFASVVSDLHAAWTQRRPEVLEQADEMTVAMRRFLEDRSVPGSSLPPVDSTSRAFESLARRFDPEWGGFGGAPKFPTPSNLFLLAELAPAQPEAAAMLGSTLDHMARGGIYDQLGGGFHRYATDRTWTVPHFEKMLYDNGLLLEVFAVEAARTGEAETVRIVRETAAFLGREMTGSHGAFWSAIDAETEGQEGAYYVWSRAETEAALGAEDAAFLAPLLGFGGPPTFEEHSYVLRLPETLADAAAQRRLKPANLRREIDTLSAALFAARNHRLRPATDDKVLVDWNGTAIAGLATAGRVLDAPELTAQAARAAEFVLENLRPNGVLCHTWRAGSARIEAYLADYAHFVRGLLALHGATDEARWLTAAEDLTQEQIERLRSPEGGFFGAAAAPDLLFRSQDPFDGALPSPNALAVLNLIELAQRTGRESYRRELFAALQAFAPLLAAHPDALRMMAVAVHRFYRSSLATAGPSHSSTPAPPSNSLHDEAQRAVQAELQVAEGRDWRTFRLALTIAPGWHLEGALGGPDAALGLTGSKGTELRSLALPVGVGDVPTLTGEVEIRGEVRATIEGQLRLRFRPCDNHRCLAETEILIAVSAGSGGLAGDAAVDSALPHDRGERAIDDARMTGEDADPSSPR